MSKHSPMVILSLPTRFRKVRRLRGSRTHGWGVSGQHRDSGMQGGHGSAGALAHKRTKLVAEGIDISKHGFKSHSAREIRTINVKDLLRLTSASPEEKSKAELPLIDLSQLGYEKLLGGGVLKEPITVKVAKASKSAMRKIEEAGGKILLPK